MRDIVDRLVTDSSPTTGPEPLGAPSDPRLLAAEIAALPRSSELARSGPLVVRMAYADAIPHVLYEIGRLRELTFRAVGEGTGKRLDLDWFDGHYLHLVLWNEEHSEIVGSYRCGATDRIVPHFGIDGLYTSTLFAYRSELVARLFPALELGRSFVRLEYQKTYSALLLLWRGIARFVVSDPRYKLLFGAVSISNDVDPRLQETIVTSLRATSYLPGLARFVRSRSPLGRDFERSTGERPPFEVGNGENGIPILLRQYLKLGGRVLGFARDPGFGNSLDVLVLVDLSTAPARALERYMGRDGLAAFLDYHRPLDVRRECPPPI